MIVKIIRVPEDCHSLEDVTDTMILTLPAFTEIETVAKMFEKPCGQEVIIHNGTNEYIKKLAGVGVITEEVK